MNAFDIFIFPIYLTFIFIIGFWIKLSNRRNETIQKYFIPALTLKILGGAIFGCIYFFYYFERGGADTVYYHMHSITLTNILIEHPWIGIKILFVTNGSTDPELSPYTITLSYYSDAATFFVTKTSAIINLFTFNSFLVTTFFFSLIGLSGCWAMFETFNSIYPDMKKINAIATLFLPSICFWGSGILKDTLTLSAAGWFIYGTYKFFILKRHRISSLLIVLFSFYCMFTIKIYIILCLIPGIIVWIFLYYNRNIKNKKVRSFLQPFFFALGVVIGIVGITKISATNDRYNMDSIANTSVITAEYIRATSSQGSSYYLGKTDASILGLSKLFIPAVIVSLFRPFIWEINNFLMVFAALESLYFLTLTVYAFYLSKLKDIYNGIIADPFLLFCLLFSIIFAFAVGVSTNNFGSLVRYKLPLLPFYYVFISNILKQAKQKKLSKETSRFKHGIEKLALKQNRI